MIKRKFTLQYDLYKIGINQLARQDLVVVTGFQFNFRESDYRDLIIIVTKKISVNQVLTEWAVDFYLISSFQYKVTPFQDRAHLLTQLVLRAYQQYQLMGMIVVNTVDLFNAKIIAIIMYVWNRMSRDVMIIVMCVHNVIYFYGETEDLSASGVGKG
jgi:hypothetical protein